MCIYAHTWFVCFTYDTDDDDDDDDVTKKNSIENDVAISKRDLFQLEISETIKWIIFIFISFLFLLCGIFYWYLWFATCKDITRKLYIHENTITQIDSCKQINEK